MPETMSLTAIGGPLIPGDVPADRPADGEVLVEQHAIGINFVDHYHRMGLYPLPGLPAVLGVEAAGVVAATGSGVEDLRPGDRVAYALPVGAYARFRTLRAERLITLPPQVEARTAAAGLLKGLTAHMLFTRVCPLGRGESMLIHAAGGGLGQTLTRWAKRQGVRVIGTVGSAAKAEAAQAAGADAVIFHHDEDFVARVRQLTDGAGVAAAVDGIGGATLARTLECVRPFGTVASIGQAAGPIPALDVADIGPKRSLSLARPSVFTYAADTARYRLAAAEVLAMLARDIPVTIGQQFALHEANTALDLLAAGRTTGSLLLVP